MNGYCITHEVRFYGENSLDETCITTSCPPPEFDMSCDWIDSLPVPSEDELILMDMNAEVLEADFIGA
jgi:hypothetical protein